MTTLSQLLDQPPRQTLAAPRDLWGFGGLHGGLGLAVLTTAMAEHADTRPLRSVSGHLLRPMRDDLAIATTAEHAGSTCTVATGRISDADGRCALAATATFGRSLATTTARHTPAPDVAPPAECPPYALPREIVPFGASVDLRPATPSRPFAGGEEPELTAWIRVADDDRAVDLARLVMLLDALAPSYAAVLTDIALLPTVQLTIHPTDGLATTSSPWLLVRAVTNAMSADGWCHEALDAWSPDGTHVGAAQQVRLLLSP